MKKKTPKYTPKKPFFRIGVFCPKCGKRIRTAKRLEKHLVFSTRHKNILDIIIKKQYG